VANIENLSKNAALFWVAFLVFALRFFNCTLFFWAGEKLALHNPAASPKKLYLWRFCVLLLKIAESKHSKNAGPA